MAIHSSILTGEIPWTEKPVELQSIVVVQSASRVQLFVTPWAVARPGPSVHRILQARILEWIAISSSRGYCPTRD